MNLLKKISISFFAILISFTVFSCAKKQICQYCHKETKTLTTNTYKSEKINLCPECASIFEKAKQIVD